MKDMPFPASNMPAPQQAWRVDVERRLKALDDIALSSKAAASNAVARWSSYTGQIGALSEQVRAVESRTSSIVEVAYDGVTWSPDRPVSPADDGSVSGADIPANPDATWFVYEDKVLSGGGTERQVKETWRWVPPTFLNGDVAGEWVLQKFGTATLGSEAIDLSNLNKALSDDINEATRAVDDLKQTSQDALKAAKDAKQAAEEAKEAANQAAQGAGADGRTIVSPTEPQGADRKPGNLWINTANGGAEPYMFDQATNTWKPVNTPDAKAAAEKAAAAERAAQQALDKAQSAEDKATAATLAAERATTAANGKNRIFYTPGKPTLSGRVDGDLWFDTDDGYKAYIYDPAKKDFVPLSFGVDNSALEGRLDEVEKKVEDVQKQALDALTKELGKIGGTLRQGPVPPDEGEIGDFWMGPDGVLYRLKTKK